VKTTTSIVKTIALVCLVMLLLPTVALAWQKKGLRLRGRAQVRYGVEDQIQSEDGLQTTDWVNYFLLRRARLDGRWKPEDWIRLMLEMEISENRVRPRDVYVRMDLHPLLRITAGQFKKPFSRLKMDSPFNLLIPERGLLNRYAIADTLYGGYGGRDTGLMISGTWDGPVRLRYYLGAFNNLLDDDSFHRDYVARLQVRVIKGLILAVNASHKYYDEEFDSGAVPRTKNMFGADIRWTLGDFRLDVEGAFGDNANTNEQQQNASSIPEIVNAYGSLLYGVHAVVSYRVKISESLILTPAFMVEVFDPSDNEGTDAVMRLAGAVNADIGKNVRVVLSAEGLLDKAIEYDSPTNIFLQLGVGF
jgi:hypothetical protein